jgi:hypothetical protein
MRSLPTVAQSQGEHVSSLRDILHSPDRVLEASRSTNNIAPAASTESSEQTEQPPQSAPSTPRQNSAPRPANHTAETRLRELVVTPPRPTVDALRQRSKRPTSLGVDELWNISGRASRPEPTAASSGGLLPPFSPPATVSREQHAADAGTTKTALAGSMESSGVGPSKTNNQRALFTLEQAKAATTIDHRTVALESVFEDLEPEELKELFGDSDNETFVHASTKLVARFDRKSRVDPKGTVTFENYFGNKIWIMDSNYRAPGMASFYMSDVVDLQVKKANISEKPKYLVRRKIESDDGEKFFKKHRLEPGNKLSPAQLEEFMTKVSNGKSSGRILEAFGLNVESAQVFVEAKGKDDEYHADDDDDDDEDHSPKAASEEEGQPLRYGIVLKIAPLDKLRDSQKPKQPVD